MQMRNRSTVSPWIIPMVCIALGGCASAPLPPLITNGLGMQMVLLTAGEFTMGNEASAQKMAELYPEYEPERLLSLADETPAHRVRITRPFYMAKHEVTVGQFRQFLVASGYVPESVADGSGGYGYNAAYDPATTKRGDAFEGRAPHYSWKNPGFAQTDAHPVVNVSWNDAAALARWLSITEKHLYRLPTEAQWEYACRAGARTHHHSGDASSSLKEVANVFDAKSAVHWPKWQDFALSFDDGFAFTAPVGQFTPNAFGLHDMHGNVWEWTADWYDETYYVRSPTDDPKGPVDGGVKVRRGGSWHTWPLYARCAYRNFNTPDSRYPLVGIRLVMEAN